MARYNKLKPVFDGEDSSKCCICDEFVSNAVKCSGGDLFCLDCIGAYADLVGNVNVTRNTRGGVTVSSGSASSGNYVHIGFSGTYRVAGNSVKISGGKWSGVFYVGSNLVGGSTMYVGGNSVVVGRGGGSSVSVSGGSVTCSRSYEFPDGQRYKKFINAIRQITNRCPKCDVEGAYSLSPGTDRALANQEVRCPFVSSAGLDCLWTGRLAKFRGHQHDLGKDKDRVDDDGSDDEDDLNVRVQIDGKVVEVKKSIRRNVKTVNMSVKI